MDISPGSKPNRINQVTGVTMYVDRTEKFYSLRRPITVNLTAEKL